MSRHLLTIGAPFFFIRIAGIIVFSTDNIIVSNFLGAGLVAPYSTGMRLVGYAQLIPSFLFPTLWASYAEASARGDIAWVQRTYGRTMRLTMLIVGVAVLAISVLGRWIIGVWTAHLAVPSEQLLLAMCVWTLISGFTTAQSCLLGAVGRARTQAISSVAAAVINLALSILLVRHIGSLGVILGTVVSYICIIIPQTREVSAFFHERRGAAGLAEMRP